MINCAFEGQTNIVHLRHVVVDALVIKDKQILLVQRGPGSYLEIGKWALPGGFLDRDETSQEAAVREVKEETGYDCSVVKLFRLNDNPRRPKELNRQSVALIYLMKPNKKSGSHDHEISEVKWFDLDKLPPKNNIAFDHLDTIKLYKFTLKKRFRLPFVGMTHDDVDSWEETLDIMSNPKLMADIKKSQQEFKQGKFVTLEQILKGLKKPKKSPGSV